MSDIKRMCADVGECVAESAEMGLWVCGCAECVRLQEDATMCDECDNQLAVCECTER